MNENEVVTEIETQIALYRSEIEPKAITNDDECRGASDSLKRVKDYIKTIDEKRRSFVDPLNATVKKINAEFKPMSDMADELRQKIETKMIAYQSAEKKRKEDAERIKRDADAEYLRKMSAATARQAAKLDSSVMLENAIVMEKKAEHLENAPIKVSATVESDTSSSTIRKTWTFDIENTLDVPREYCSPDEGIIRNAIKVGVRTIKGVRIYQKESIQTR